MSIEIREARDDDRDAVFEFTSETWDREDEEKGGWDYIPDVWDDWLGGGGTVLVAEDEGKPVGIVRVTAFLTEEAWLEGMRVHPDYRREGVATQLTEEAVETARRRGARVARCMTFDWNDEAVELLGSLDFERCAEFRHGRGFGFPYGTQLQDATFDASIDAIRETDAYEAMDGLYATRNWKMLEIPERVGNFLEGVEILAYEADDDIRSIAICDGVRTNTTGTEERTELVFGFVWCDTDYASEVALDIRAETREREVNDALVFVPDDEDYVNAFEQSGFDFSGVDYVYEKEIV